MAFNPELVVPGTLPSIEQAPGKAWTPLYRHACSFPPEIFREVMLNLIRNPNINSNHLFRADISLDCLYSKEFLPESSISPRIEHFKGFTLKTIMVRTMIPRNVVIDRPLDQTCLLYDQAMDSGEILSLIIYLPHITSAAELPFYHPAVHGIGFLHVYDPVKREGVISIHYSFFESEPRSVKLERTALHLLAVLHKHGQGLVNGYVKRVKHDVILPQAKVQNTYARLKAKYARSLSQAWVEDTDPGKHVFEDLGIAAFLIELWAEMYKDIIFPGFVDIGCGNGLLVHLLIEEGYSGWGFDARRRKSWSIWSTKSQESLKEMILIPSIVAKKKVLSEMSNNKTQHTNPNSKLSEDAPKTLPENSDNGIQPTNPTLEPAEDTAKAQNLNENSAKKIQEVGIHDGVFPKGTFIISNHADELTPWTPILANLSESPFMMIPCCSHALSGDRFRAPPPKNAGASSSAYASLVAWVSKLAIECGWKVEKEMLRIPSTRNTALIGRHRNIPFEDVDTVDLVDENGGAICWEENALKLVKSAARGH
jgi:tRNASer (uridine44-2'-O)-methyltransferase